MAAKRYKVVLRQNGKAVGGLHGPFSLRDAKAQGQRLADDVVADDVVVTVEPIRKRRKNMPRKAKRRGKKLTRKSARGPMGPMRMTVGEGGRGGVKRTRKNKGKIQVDRKGYWRKGYTRKDGTKVKRTWVPATSFSEKDPGRPGRRARGSKKGPYKKDKKWIQRKGKLGGPGYTKKKATTRRGLLTKAVKKYGYRSTLGSLMVLLRSTEISKTDKKKIAADKNWLVKKYGGPGSFKR